MLDEGYLRKMGLVPFEEKEAKAKEGAAAKTAAKPETKPVPVEKPEAIAPETAVQKPEEPKSQEKASEPEPEPATQEEAAPQPVSEEVETKPAPAKRGRKKGSKNAPKAETHTGIVAHRDPEPEPEKNKYAEVVTCRIPEDLLLELDKEVARRNQGVIRPKDRYTRTQFILEALEEALGL